MGTNKLLVASLLLLLLHTNTCSLMTENELQFYSIVPGMIYIGGLGDSFTKGELKTYFKEFGDIQKIIQHKNPNNKVLNRGYAFLEYKDPSAIVNCQIRDHNFLGTLIDCRQMKDYRNGINVKEEEAETRQFISRMSPFETSTDLKKYFSQFSPVSRAYVIMNPKNPNIDSCYGDIYFKEKCGAQLCFNGIKEKGHHSWRARWKTPKHLAQKMTPLNYYKKSEALPSKETGEYSSAKKIESSHKNFQNDQNQEVTNQDQNKNNNANFANSETTNQKNYWNNFAHRENYISQNQNLYDVSVNRDTEIEYWQYYGNNGFEQQCLPYQGIMYEQVANEQVANERYQNQINFDQEQYHRRYHEMQDYADPNEFYDRDAREGYMDLNLDYKLLNEISPDMQYWGYQYEYPWTSFYNNENRSQWHGNYNNFRDSTNFAQTMDLNHTERVNHGTQYFDQRGNDNTSGVHAQSTDGDRRLAASLKPRQSKNFESLDTQM